MILAYYGKWILLEKLRQECGVTHDGSNAENILKAAENFGCVAKSFAGPPVALRKKAKNNFLLILFWEFNHFVVLESIKGYIVYRMITSGLAVPVFNQIFLDDILTMK